MVISLTRVLIVIGIVTLMPGGPAALKIHEKEVRKIKPIQFTNYQARREGRANSAAEIRSIGYQLANQVNKQGRANYYNKYSVVVARSRAGENKLNADVFAVLKRARVKHIAVLRSILASYFEKNYGYNRADAEVLARFVTYYNAYYRKNYKFFAEKYNSKTVANMTRANAGLDTHYRRWPGQSRIVIPLVKVGNKNEVDTSEVTDEKIIEKLREKEDRAVEDRKEIQRIKKDQQRRQREEIKKDERQTTTSDRNEIDERRQNLDREEERTRQEDQNIKKDENRLAAEETDTSKDRNTRREEQLRDKEKELERREDELRDKLVDNVYRGKMYFLKLNKKTSDGHFNNEMFILEPYSGAVIARSDIKNIDSPKFDIFSEGVVVIAHNKLSRSMHNLVILDLNDLRTRIRGRQDIYWKSFVQIRKQQIYAIMKKEEKFHLARFDNQLNLQAISKITVAEDTFISFFGDKVYVNKNNQQIVVLNEKDLSQANLINPN